LYLASAQHKHVRAIKFNSIYLRIKQVVNISMRLNSVIGSCFFEKYYKEKKRLQYKVTVWLSLHDAVASMIRNL